ncbi:hypothetical protein PG994_004217 [Apiospora phragmitis]|uniref:NB-ARC domain-containing protein n=1 Tax=Apiospora phragmitis TaxID=2905665 RepID=A0ABR1VPY9_9PEZI
MTSASACDRGEALQRIASMPALHGLNGHREQTWVASNNTHWLRDLLPADIPNARIMSWGYDANTHSSSGISCQYLYDHARSLVSDLCRKRQLTDGGNGVQLGKLLVNIASLFVPADDHILRHLKDGSEWLQQQLGQYGPISRDFVTKFAYEEYLTRTVLSIITVIPRASAVMPGQADAELIVIHTDHSHMVKFVSKDDPGYQAVSGDMQIMMRNVIASIQSRWEAETRSNEAREGARRDRFSLSLDLSVVPTIEHFVARTEELKSLHEILEKPGRRRRTAVVYGLGGMGKTQLAAEYLRQYQSDYSATVWLNARDETSLQQNFVQVAERLLQLDPQPIYIKLALDSRKPHEITTAVKRWFDQPQNDRWLLVYNNYDDPKPNNVRQRGTTADNRTENEMEEDESKADMPRKEYDIRPYFPASDHGAIIVTTRSSVVQFGKRVRLAKLRDLSDGLQILASTSHRDDVEKDQAAVEVAKRLDGLPLALATAGVYLFDVTTSWAEYLEMYQNSWSRLQQGSPDLPAYDSTMYATWNISFARIQKQDQAAAKLLGMWAYFNKDDLWYELLHQGGSGIPKWLEDMTEGRITFDKTMRVLCSHGLVDANPATRECGAQSRGYNVHGCVHSWMQHILNPTTNLELTKAAIRCVARHVPSETEREYWWVQRRLIQHADHGLSMIGPTNEMDNEAWAFGSLGNLYKDQGRLVEAEAMYQRAIQGNEKALGADHTSTLDIVTNLGFLHTSQGRLDEAETMYQRALEGYETALGADHTSTLRIVNHLGLLYVDQGRLDEAETIYRRALQGNEKALGADYTSTLDIVNNLGLLYIDQGRLDEAETIYRRAIEGYEKALRANHTSTLRTVTNLGFLHASQGRLDEAETVYRRAIEGYEKVLGADHTSTLRTVTNLGFLHTSQGRLDKAETMYQRAIEGYEKALGADHISTLRIVTNLGRLDEAETVYRRAIKGKKKALGANHTSTLDTVNNLGLLYISQGRLNEAETVYRRAIEGYEKVLGANYTSTLRTVTNLGRLDEAETVYRRAIEGKKKVLGADHTSTLDTVNNLGLLYISQGRLDEAETMYRRAIEGYEKALGANYTSTLRTINNLGILYASQGRLDEAETVYRRAIEGYEKALGADHTSTLRTVNNLGILYASQGRLGEAETMYQRALEGYEKALGGDMVKTYPPALNTLENLGDLLQKQGKVEGGKGYYGRAEDGIRIVYGELCSTFLYIYSFIF